MDSNEIIKKEKIDELKRRYLGMYNNYINYIYISLLTISNNNPTFYYFIIYIIIKRNF